MDKLNVLSESSTRGQSVTQPSELGSPKRTETFWVAVIGLVVSALLAVAAAVFMQSSLNDLNEMADKRKSALIGQIKIERFMSLLKDLETGQRGFAITGINEYLEPYNTALVELPAAYETMIQSTQSLSNGDFDWVKFARAVTARTAQAEAIVLKRQQRGADILSEPQLFSVGKQSMDLIRANVAMLGAAQSRRVGELDTQMQALRKGSNRLQWISSLLAGMMTLTSVALFVLERRRRHRLEEQLRIHASLLENRVAERTEALSSASSQIRKFSIKLEHRIEAEHRRISREVHDQLGQIFTAIKMIFHSIKPGSMAPDQQEAMTHAIDSGVATTRRIAAELRPPLLDDLGLAVALEQHVVGVAKLFGLTGTVNVSGQEVLTESQALQLFRMVQEACTNAGRHAKAQNLVITGVAVNHGYELSIEDDGQGIDAESMREGSLGLVGLSELAAMMEGQIRVQARTGGGTCVWVRIPLHWSRRHSQMAGQNQ